MQHVRQAASFGLSCRSVKPGCVAAAAAFPLPPDQLVLSQNAPGGSRTLGFLFPKVSNGSHALQRAVSHTERRWSDRLGLEPCGAERVRTLRGPAFLPSAEEYHEGSWVTGQVFCSCCFHPLTDSLLRSSSVKLHLTGFQFCSDVLTWEQVLHLFSPQKGAAADLHLGRREGASCTSIST